MNPEFIAALIGGMLIGLAASLMWRLYGRIMGTSGMVSGLLQADSDWGWKMAFVVGTLLSPWLYALFADMPKVVITDNPVLLVLGGLLVGYGTRLGSGCTSGHGMCGLGRLSMRSLAAVVTFMLFAFITVYVLKHVLGVA
ncbi:MAG: YeeE/YedE thiosulfate transporter family protein [Neisseria sp.]